MPFTREDKVSLGRYRCEANGRFDEASPRGERGVRRGIAARRTGALKPTAADDFSG